LRVELPGSFVCCIRFQYPSISDWVFVVNFQAIEMHPVIKCTDTTTVTRYHCSPVKIDQFDFTTGCHFGGYLSSLEAALRKRSEGQLFIHRVKITYRKSVMVDDLCNKQAWDTQCSDMRKAGVSVAVYRNIHEPDFTSSYFVVDPKCVEITDVTVIDCDQAEQIITEALY
jgi:hypothetical protein